MCGEGIGDFTVNGDTRRFEYEIRRGFDIESGSKPLNMRTGETVNKDTRTFELGKTYDARFLV